MEQVTQADRKIAWPDPTPEMLKDAKFEAIWQMIKSWDINVPEAYAGYMGATGNHARAILEATRTTDQAKDEEIARYREALEQLLDAYITTCLFDGAAMFEVEQHNAVRLARKTLGASNA